MLSLDRFAEVWLADFEYIADGGRLPDVVCGVFRERRSGRTIKLWRGEFGPAPPFDIGRNSLYVAYYASAEIGCHLALGWPVPACILDLYCEFRAARNGLSTPAGSGLIGALIAYGLDSMQSEEKHAMRDLVLRGGPWSAAEREAILRYCEQDVLALGRLLPGMAPRIDLPRALLRGRYMAAVAQMERTGVPIDTDTLDRLRERWEFIKAGLVREIDAAYGVFDGTTFKRDRFERYLARERIPWPRLESGALDLSDDTFRERARADLRIAPLRELRAALAQLRLTDLQVGPDGRNRCLLSPFRARTGRNQPSASRFIFGPSVWLRSLIRPAPGMAVAYLDWSCQELAIAAALSGDTNLLAAYASGDPYIAFARQAGAVPADATKDSHPRERGVFKTIALGTLYGMQEWSLAHRAGITPLEARELLRRHRETYPRFWAWSQAMTDHAMLRGVLPTVFGWPLRIGENVNVRSLLNHPMQANAAEMMRLAAIMATERGVRVCAPVHDAFLIEAPANRIEATIAEMRACMAEAARLVLAGRAEVKVDAGIVRHPDRYSDPRGVEMWNRVMDLLQEDRHARQHA